MTQTVPSCSHCKQPMQPVELPGHYGRQVEIDICSGCHLVWFDSLESVRLSGLGWLRMLRRMEAAHRVEHRRLDGAMGCARCSRPLKLVHNQTAFGRSTARECPQGHGQYQSFNLLLAERGLIRPVLPSDLAAARKAGRVVCCVNCGGDVGRAADAICPWCASPIALLDVARLIRALAPGLALSRDGAEADAAGGGSPQHLAWPCAGCGAPVDPSRHDACPGCGHAVLAPTLAEVLPLLDRLEPELDALRGSVQAADCPVLPARLAKQRIDALERSRVKVPWQDAPQPEEPDDEQLRRRLGPAVVGLGLLLWWVFRRR